MVAQQQQSTSQFPGVSVQTAAASAGSRDAFWIKDKDGSIVKTEIAPEQYGTAPRQGYYRLRWKGVSDIFDMDGEFGKSKNVRLLFVINQPGVSEHKKLFADMGSVMKWGEKSQSFYWNLGSQSKMGRIIEAITGTPLEPSATINLADYLGGEFEAMVKSTTGPDKNGAVRTKSSVAYDTITAVGSNAPAPGPEPQPVATGANPFLMDDDL
jgi:hypothetical protein